MPQNRDIALSEQALLTLDTLESAGGEAWVVGGMVRNSLLGLPVSDADIACSLDWRISKQAIENAGWTCHETGIKYGTITAVIDDAPIEITSFRSDASYEDNRHPGDVIPVSSIEEDLARRDFTVNAIAFHPQRGYRDPYCGQADLQAHIIRSVRNPDFRLREDALRILRGLRLAAQYEFEIEEQTLGAMRSNAHLLQNISPQRIAPEMEKLICGTHAAQVLVEHADILGAAIPEITPMIGCEQHSKYHIYDVLTHTAHVLKGVSPRKRIRWAALLHDIGKPSVRHIDNKGNGHFLGHQKAGVSISREILGRLGYSRQFIDEVSLLVRLHDDYLEPNDASVRKTLRKLGGNIDLAYDLFELMQADSKAKNIEVSNRYDIAMSLPGTLAEVLEKRLPYLQSHLAINGSDLIAMGFEPGPQIGVILEQLLTNVIEGKMDNTRESLTYAAKASNIFLA